MRVQEGPLSLSNLQSAFECAGSTGSPRQWLATGKLGELQYQIGRVRGAGAQMSLSKEDDLHSIERACLLVLHHSTWTMTLGVAPTLQQLESLECHD